MSCLKRIKKELKSLDKDFCCCPSVSASLVDHNDLYHWQGTIVGPEGTPF